MTNGNGVNRKGRKGREGSHAEAFLSGNDRATVPRKKDLARKPFASFASFAVNLPLSLTRGGAGA